MFRKHPEPMSDCKLNEGPFPCSGEGHTTELDYPSPLFYFERNSYLDCLGSTWAHPVVQIRLVFIMWSSCLSFSRSRVLGLHQAWLCILLFKYEMHSLVNLGKKILIIILCVCCCCSAFCYYNPAPGQLIHYCSIKSCFAKYRNEKESELQAWEEIMFSSARMNLAFKASKFSSW